MQNPAILHENYIKMPQNIKSVCDLDFVQKSHFPQVSPRYNLIKLIYSRKINVVLREFLYFFS